MVTTVTTCRTPANFPFSSFEPKKSRAQAKSGATKAPTVVVPVPATNNNLCISRSVDDSTAAKNTSPPQTITLVSGGKINQPSNPTTPKLHLHHPSQMAVRQCYLFA